MHGHTQSPLILLNGRSGCGRPGSFPTRRRWPWGRLGRNVAWVLGFVLLGAVSVAAQPRSYTVDARASKVQVLVRKAGLMALLAHDHVLEADGFGGRVTVDPLNLSASALQVSVPVASLRVDPPEARLEHRLDGEIDDDDRAEIKEAMLSPEQFDAANFPRVIATLERASGQLPDVMLALRVRIKQTEKVIRVPLRVELVGDEMRASGSFELLQSDFGIEPFSSLLGAIGVEDRVLVRFRIVARADAG